MSERTPETLRRRLFEFAKEFPLFKLLGIELLEVEPKRAQMRLTLRDDLRNPNGVMHGGVIATLIDTAISQSMLMTDEYQKLRETRGSMTSVDLRIKYLRPVGDGAITCDARITHLGRRVGHASAVVTNAEGKEIALGDSIIMLTSGGS